MYNLLEYSSSYSDRTGNLWFYSKDESTNFNNYVSNTDALKSFKYKAKLLANTVAQSALNQDNGILKKMQQWPCHWSIYVIFGYLLKCHWLIAKLNWNSDGQSIV